MEESSQRNNETGRVSGCELLPRLSGTVLTSAETATFTISRQVFSVRNPRNLEDIPEDPGNAFPAETGLLEFCITQLENVLTDKDNNQDMEYLNDEELQVCCFLSGKS